MFIYFAHFLITKSNKSHNHPVHTAHRLYEIINESILSSIIFILVSWNIGAQHIISIDPA